MRSWMMTTMVAAALAALAAPAAETNRPVRALLICGGCCHDYNKQKDILKTGLEERANVVVDIVYCDNGSTKPPFEIYGHPQYADGYDVVIHDECAAGIGDEATVKGVLAPHAAGLPGVNLHCAMHSYRIGNPAEPVTDVSAPHGWWFDYLGLQSSGHGPKKPVAIDFAATNHPAIAGQEDWTTINEELYNNIKVWDAAAQLAVGRQEGAQDAVVVWTHLYGPKKARVFSTTIGHFNETVADPRYLDLVTRGLLWAVNRPDAFKKPATINH